MAEWKGRSFSITNLFPQEVAAPLWELRYSKLCSAEHVNVCLAWSQWDLTTVIKFNSGILLLEVFLFTLNCCFVLMSCVWVSG